MLEAHVTVAAVVERDGRFLCVEEEVAGALVINQPAGHLEAGETLLAAVHRETLEETAWQFAPTALLGVYHYKSASGITYLRFAFIGDVSDHDPARPLDNGIRRALWLSEQDLRARQAQHRGPQVLQAVADYRRGQRYPLDVLVHLGDTPLTA
ncbi:MAG: NUDIX hydrolase [Gammaproteobacteria bacterium]|nr:NUDIX hydrolase [Gammaproteobacteria bacterium]